MQLDFIYHGTNLLQNRLLCCLYTLLLCLPAHAIADEWIYTVKPGDNLWNLSERHLTGVQYVQRLQKLNRIGRPLCHSSRQETQNTGCLVTYIRCSYCTSHPCPGHSTH